jgi:hypothetical protein
VPPEIARGDRDDVGTHTDLHMLGSLLYHALTGHMPFEHRDKLEALLLAAGNDYRPVEELAPQAPRRLVEAARRAMAFLPEERGTVEDFRNDLKAYLGREAVRAAPLTATFTAYPPPKREGLAGRLMRRLRGTV